MNTVRLWPYKAAPIQTCIDTRSAVQGHGYKKGQIAPCSSASHGCVTLDDPVNLSLLYKENWAPSLPVLRGWPKDWTISPTALFPSLLPNAALFQLIPSGSSSRRKMPRPTPYQQRQTLWPRHWTSIFLRAPHISATRVETRCPKVTDS